jgi:hypothetical protein
MKVVIAGGGWAGCAAALSAYKQGSEVVLLERAAEEMIAMSAGELFELIDLNTLHRDISFPGHHHASLYNVGTMEPIVRAFLMENGIDIHLSTRGEDVEMEGVEIKAISAKRGKERIRFEGDAFIDTTGTAGPPANCTKYGNGCAMCILRCPSFGGRVSLTAKAGVEGMVARKEDQLGAMSGSCKIHKESLSQEIAEMLGKTGVAVIPVHPERQMKGKLAIKACEQYAIPEFEKNLVLLDTGHAKLMVPFFPLDALRQIPGFENARYEDPYAGGLGNSIRYMDMAPRDDTLKVSGTENLFCAGEKAGLLVGHTEAIVTGTLAGYNAVRHIKREKPLILPPTLAVGEAITYVRTQMEAEEGLGHKYTFSGSILFDRIKQRGLYSTDPREIETRVDAAGMRGIFSKHSL